MKKIAFICFVTNIILNSYSIAQSIYGTYYVDDERSTKEITIFKKELAPTKTNVGIQVDFWTFNDGVLKRGWMRYTLNNGVFYCPWDQQDSRRSFYKIDQENNSLMIWYSKKDKKRLIKPNQNFQIIRYNPLTLKSAKNE